MIGNRSNILRSLATDAYKASHFLQLPPNSTSSKFYIAPRKPLSNSHTKYIVFGIRYFIEKYLQTPINQTDLNEIEQIWNHFNVGNTAYTFPKQGFQKIVSQYNGYLPITIVGVQEGQILDQYNVPIFIISVDDPELCWLPGFIETALQRSIWYASTVATISFNIKQILKEAYTKSVDSKSFDTIYIKLHDFGARGASSGESAALGGLSHLLNFTGTDTMEAVYLGHKLYNIPIQELACSIPAAEHSTVTSWGNGFEGERESLLNLINVCKKNNDKVFAFVSDSYDFFHTVDHLWGDPKVIKLIKDSKLYPVVRPDSGDPIKVVLYALESLSKSWGYTTNSKGYKVLDTIRIIQGDGMDTLKISNLINAIIEKGFSVENVSFGMGGGLLQKLNRDTMSWSMKMYKIKIDGEWRDVFKKPSTQQDKESFNPKNVVDDKDWVIHYKYSDDFKKPLIHKESFQEIRKRTEI